jgi:hypothetical protein
MRRVFLTLICFAIASRAMLPPGYEDEIYCPDGMCLVRAPHPNGWSGPMTLYMNCMNILDHTTTTTIRPRGWGSLVDPSIKKELIDKGWKIAQRCVPITRGLFISKVFNSLP